MQVKTVDNPGFFKQLSSREPLITVFNCSLDKKFEDAWSHYNYIAYVMGGRRIWHTDHGSYDLSKDSCVFVRKGTSIVEQAVDGQFCLVRFFVPDEFIREVLKTKSTPIQKPEKKYEFIMPVKNDVVIQAFFRSITPYFDNGRPPDQSLLELKFRELILATADNPANGELLSYFSYLLREPQTVSLRQIMEDNFYFNLKMEEYARLCSRSLSAFKRDFVRLYNMSPGKWLMERRLNHALHLITNIGKTVSESAFESGFESPSHFSRAFRQRFGTSPCSVKQAALLN